MGPWLGPAAEAGSVQACTNAEPATSVAAAVAAAAAVVVAVDGIAPVAARAAVTGPVDSVGTGRKWRRTADTGYSCPRCVSGRWSAVDVEVCRRVVYHSKGTGCAFVRADGRY